jgi:hypothetical protein
MKKIIIVLAMIFPSLAFSGISVFGGQGYGAFRLAGASSVNLSSIMIAGIKFSEYFDFRYLSLDTALRMPVLPFRVLDIKYNKNGDTYTSYDSDVFGISFNIPVTERFKIGLLYGLGKSEIGNLTKQSSGDYIATIHKSFIQAFNAELTWTMPFEMFIVSPKIGMLMHFLDKDSGYDNAASYYGAVSITYVFEQEDKK